MLQVRSTGQVVFDARSFGDEVRESTGDGGADQARARRDTFSAAAAAASADDKKEVKRKFKITFKDTFS